MNKILLSIAVLIFIAGIIFPQNENKDHLDSLFNEYVKLKSGKPGTKLPSIESYNEKAIKCGFPLFTNIKHNFNNFSPEQRAIINKLYVRPDLQKSIASPYGHFRIHYDTTGYNTPGYDGRTDINAIINDVAKILDSVYDFEILYLGYPEPPKDNRLGGDDLYDIYLENTGNYYGMTTPETAIGNNVYTSYIEINNSFPANIFYTSGINAAMVTLAHEFHHAIQIGKYKYDEQDTYFHEMTSTSMEEFVFSSVNDYYEYIGKYFNNPQKSFSKPADEGYSLAVWNIFLHEQFGYEGYKIIQQQWVLYEKDRALTAINTSLYDYHTTFKEQLNKFSIWCYYTGYRTIEGQYFTEAKNYPLIKPTYQMNFTPNEQSWYISVKPLSNNYLRILGDNSIYTDTIYSIITNGDFTAGLNSPGSNFQSKFSIFSDSASGRKHIGNNYYSSFTADNIDDYLETNIFNNLLIDTTYYYNAIDFAFPNPFRYSQIQNSKINLPVEGKLNESARYYIFSIAMKLVYSGISKITTSADKIVLQWNGLDNNNSRLSTGVYIYITDFENSIKKGKIVIFNE